MRGGLQGHKAGTEVEASAVVKGEKEPEGFCPKPGESPPSYVLAASVFSAHLLPSFAP